MFNCFILLFAVGDYRLPWSVKECRQKLHKEFSKNRTIDDISTIDKLVMRSQIDLKDIVYLNRTRRDIYDKFNGENYKRRSDFYTKFLIGRT